MPTKPDLSQHVPECANIIPRSLEDVGNEDLRVGVRLYVVICLVRMEVHTADEEETKDEQRDDVENDDQQDEPDDHPVDQPETGQEEADQRHDVITLD